MPKLGKDFGSIVNYTCSLAKEPATLYVGMPLTMLYWSDRHPYEIVEVKDQKHIKIRELDHKSLKDNSFTECQEYEYIPNPNNPVITMTKRGKYWYSTTTITKDILDEIEKAEPSQQVVLKCFLANHNITPEALLKRGKITKYSRENLAFGFAEYYYDWSF